MSLNTVKAKAPGRCGILGNPSDIYGGKVLSCSIPDFATCILAKSDTWSLPDDLRLWSSTQVRFPIDTPLSIGWTTQIPRSSGLSGSTALLAATLAAVLVLKEQSPPLATSDERSEFAELLRDVERFDAGIMCGYQDAYMIVHGHTQLMDFKGKHPGQKGPNAKLTPLTVPLPFLLITTGVERLSGSVHGPIVERWIRGEEMVRKAIGEISELAEPGAELLKTGDYSKFGALMDRNQELVASLGGSGEPVDRLIGHCKANGALGAKLAGAGLGGTVIALSEEPEKLQERLRAEGYTKFLRPEDVAGLVIEMDGNVTP